MKEVKRGGAAAIVVGLAFLVHLANQFWFEPRMGFGSIADYADTARLAVGLRSGPWVASGLAHGATGVALIVFGLAACAAFAQRRPGAARAIVVFTALAGLAFLLTAVVDVPGRRLLWALDAANPSITAPLIASAALLRGVLNLAAIVLAGCALLCFTWSARQVKALSLSTGVLGYLAGAAGVATFLSPGAYGAAYLLIPAWAILTGLRMRADPQRFIETPLV